MRTQHLHVGDRVRRGVVRQVSGRPGPPGAALVEYDDAVVQRIEEAAVQGAGARAWTAVQEHDGRPVRISRLFPVHFMTAVQSKMAGAQRFDFRIKLGANAWRRKIHIRKTGKVAAIKACREAGMVETIAKSPACDKPRCCVAWQARGMRPV